MVGWVGLAWARLGWAGLDTASGVCVFYFSAHGFSITQLSVEQSDRR